MTRVLIQAVPWVPWRAVNAARTAKAVDGQIVWDEDSSGFDTWLRVLETAGSDPTIIMEDDVTLTSRWREKIEREIAARPTSVIRFFSTRSDDAVLGSRWMDGKDFYYNQCLYLPAGYAQGLREWIGDRRPRAFLDMHDNALGQWLKKRNEQFWHHSPSLVQHYSGESTIKKGRPLKGRQSASYQP